MGGTFTQKRKIRSEFDRLYIRRANGNEVNSSWNEVFDTAQETTSYRTVGADLKLSRPDYFRVVGARTPLVLERDLFDFAYFKGERYDTGHPFSTFKKETSFSHPYIQILGRNGTRYRGPLVPSRTAFGLSNGYMAPVFNSLDAKGAIAIAATKPTNSIASVSTLLAELKREGLPQLPGSQSYAKWLRDEVRSLRGLGKDYLNIEFAWKPTINELVNVLNAVTQVPKVLEQLAKDSGKHVRRKFRFEDERTITADVTNISSAVITTAHNTNDNNRMFAEVVPGNPNLIYNNGPLRKTEQTVTSSWFSGAFTYFFETDEDLFAKARMYEQLANKLLGLRLTPEVLWELTPWSWLADWFANFGEIAANVSSFSGDGLVMRYGYMMQTVVCTRTLTQDGVRLQGYNTFPYSVSYVTTSKQRVRATPFGFGLDPGSFTTRQWAILASLALAKGPRSLYN